MAMEWGLGCTVGKISTLFRTTAIQPLTMGRLFQVLSLGKTGHDKMTS